MPVAPQTSKVDHSAHPWVETAGHATVSVDRGAFDSALLRHRLRRTGEASLLMMGRSMSPLFPPGSRVTLRAMKPGENLRGAIVAVDCGPKVVVHRVIRAEGATIVTQGLNARDPDQPTSQSRCDHRCGLSAKRLACERDAPACGRFCVDPVHSQPASPSQAMVTTRTISVAGVRVEFHGDQAAAEIIDRRYSAFYPAAQGLPEDVEPDAKVELDLYPAPEQIWAGRFVDVTQEDGKVRLQGSYIQATIHDDASFAQIKAPCTERSIDGVVRYLLSEHLMKRGGLLVHASAVLHEGRAWVFAGASGSGKSTLAKHLGGRCLGDEAIALLPTTDQVFAHATPYWLATPGQALMRALVFHQQDTVNRLCPVSQSRALAKLVSCTGPLLPQSLGLAMERAEAIITALSPALMHLSLASITAIEDWLPEQMSNY